MLVSELNQSQINRLINFLSENTYLDSTEIEKCLAFAIHKEISVSELKYVEFQDNNIEYDGESWLVLDDSEADERWEEELDWYIEECIMPEIPKYLQWYFDEEKWKNDARNDGRGHSISKYDGN